ncbi:MAG: hypothetical protein Kow0069_07250 [Promethearchaeota archaeon]
MQRHARAVFISILSLAILTTSVVPSFWVPVRAASDDSYEENDYFYSARYISPNYGSESFLYQLVMLEGDDDWFQFYVPAGRRVMCRANFTYVGQGRDLDLVLYLYNDETNVVNESRRSATETMDYEEIVVPYLINTQTFNLKVESVAKDFNYTLEIIVEPTSEPLDDQFEDNDYNFVEYAQLDLVPVLPMSGLNETGHATSPDLVYKDERDTYVVYLEEGLEVSVNLTYKFAWGIWSNLYLQVLAFGEPLNPNWGQPGNPIEDAPYFFDDWDLRDDGWETTGRRQVSFKTNYTGPYVVMVWGNSIDWNTWFNPWYALTINTAPSSLPSHLKIKVRGDNNETTSLSEGNYLVLDARNATEMRFCVTWNNFQSGRTDVWTDWVPFDDLYRDFTLDYMVDHVDWLKGQWVPVFFQCRNDAGESYVAYDTIYYRVHDWDGGDEGPKIFDIAGFPPPLTSFALALATLGVVLVVSRKAQTRTRRG